MGVGVVDGGIEVGSGSLLVSIAGVEESERDEVLNMVLSRCLV